MEYKTMIIIALVAVLFIGAVAGWSYVKVGKNYILTLDSGNIVNVTNITYEPSTRYASATLRPLNRLSIKDVVQIKQITENITDTLSGKKNVYVQVKIIQ